MTDRMSLHGVQHYRGYAVSTYALQDLSLEEAVDRLIGEGCRAIEIMGEGPHGELLDWPEERIARLKRRGDEHSVAWSLHAPIAGLNPAALEAEAIWQTLQALAASLRAAELLGCAYIVVHPGDAVGDDMADSGAGADIPANPAERVARVLRQALESAPSDVIIALENVPPYPGLLGTDVEFLERVIALTASPRVRVVFDVGHAHLTGEGRCLSGLRAIRPYLAAVHLSDNHGEHDDHLRLGGGNVPLAEVVRELRASDFDGTWVLELASLPDAEASAAWMREQSVHK